MKKILYLILVFFPLSLSAQLQGTGTFSDPYYGEVFANTSITRGSGIRYIASEGIIVSNATLTIQAGTTLAFLNDGIIYVADPGRIVANGTSSSQIRFTADNDGDGIMGESGETWSGLVLDSDQASTINYCIFDHGKILTDSEIYGINLFLIGTSQTVTNCTFRENIFTSTSDACVYVGDGISSSTATLTNCTFNNNASPGVIVASLSTGTINGSSFYNNSRFSVFSSGNLTLNTSKFYSNTSLPVKTTAGTLLINNSLINNNVGGVSFAGAAELTSTDTKIVNTTIVNNTTSKSNWPGGVYVSNQVGTVIVNTLFWRNRRGLSTIDDISASAATLSNCALSETVSGQIDLENSNNLGPLGPNFVNPVTPTNYSITVLSPCRDAGANSYTGVTIPTSDINGQARVGTTDIGAYENVYTKWLGGTSTVWSLSGNWSAGVPGTTRDIIISNGSFDPVITANTTVANIYNEAGAVLTVNPSFLFTGSSVINNGTLTILPLGAATFSNFYNTGTINLESDATGMFSLMLGTFTESGGSVNSEIYLTGGDAGSGDYRWHYFAPPASVNKSEVLTDISTDNLLRYDDSRVTSTKEQGWQWHDGWNGSTTVPGDAFTTLDLTRGYNFYHSNTSGATATFTTTSIMPVMSLVSVQNSYVSGPNPNLFGWNLLGNSLTCAIDWDLVLFPLTHVRNAVYYTKDNSMASYVDGIGVNGGGRYIPPLQGFFVKTDSTEELDFSAAKVHATIQPYYKKSNSSSFNSSSDPEKSYIRLEINQAGKADETVVRLEKNATDLFDAKYDATKWIAKNSDPQLFSILSGQEFCINSIPFPDSVKKVPLGIVIPSDGTFSIRKTAINAIGATDVFLKDLQQNITIDLKKTSEYSFYAAKGTSTTRFELVFSNSVTSVDDVMNNSKEFIVYQEDNNVIIKPDNDKWNGAKCSVSVISLTGKTVASLHDLQLYDSIPVTISHQLNAGVYLVEIRADFKRYVAKIVIR